MEVALTMTKPKSFANPLNADSLCNIIPKFRPLFNVFLLSNFSMFTYMNPKTIKPDFISYKPIQPMSFHIIYLKK